MKSAFPYVVKLLLVLNLTICAEEMKPATNLEEIVVTAEAESDEAIQDPWLPAVRGTSIYSGKKTKVVDFDELPKIVANNYRQALVQTPGLLISEESNPLVSIGYRGLNPARTQFTQVLRDGIPIHADQFGYPEAYYTPPLDTVDRIEFLHGGASLQYGPQPGGSLNYLTHRPRTDKKFSFKTENIVGSDNLYSTFTAVDGTVGKLGYYGYFNHREADGFRSSNSDYSLDNGSIKLLYEITEGQRLILNVDSYEQNMGEPGGLTQSDFAQGNMKATRLNDRLRIARDSVSLTYENEIEKDSALTINTWWSDYERFSKRQRGGGFGTLPTGSTSGTNSIESQEFINIGLDARYRKDWGKVEDKKNTFTMGIQLSKSDSPRIDSRGVTAFADTGVVRNDSDREVLYAPVFLENRFRFGNFSITPGLRVESFQQKIKENTNVEKVAAGKSLLDIDEDSTVLLAGLGLEYEVSPGSSFYGNISQGYRPKIFTQSVPTGPTVFINDDLEESKSVEYELGFRSHPNDWLSWDVSAFLLQFDDQIGSVVVPGGTQLENVGNALHQGLDLSFAVDLLALSQQAKTENALQFFVNATLLHAETTSGATKGKQAQYAPELILRSGLSYHHGKKAKVAFTVSHLSDHYGDSSNTKNFEIPAYLVCDLTAEYRINENVKLLAGVNNLFDESYFSRVTSNGIDPGNDRNVYAGLSLEF
jgi:Fe(3+) dicitrate transport protein